MMANQVFDESANTTMEYNNKTVESFEDLSLIRAMSLPIVIVGWTGNILSILVFLSRNMRQYSSSVFLIALAMADNVMLTNITITWLDGKFTILNSGIICKLFVFTSYIGGFLSVWLVVGFTCERYIAILFPLHRKRLCSVFRQKVAVLVMTLVAAALYSHSLWTTDVYYIGERFHCSPKMEFLTLLKTTTWIDSFITMVIPFIAISVMNGKVVFKLINYSDQRVRQSELFYQNMSESYIPRRQRTRPARRMTRTMLLVSTTFLVLNFPSHFVRFSLMLSSNLLSLNSWEIRLLHEISQILYYLTFSCNFFLYTIFGPNFMRSLRELVFSKTLAVAQLPTSRLRLSSVPTQIDLN